MIGAETGDIGEGSEREIIVEMRLDEVAHPLQPLRREALVAGRQGTTPNETLSEANTQGRAQAFDQDPVGEAAFDFLGQSRDDLARQGVLQPIQEFELGCCRPKLR